MSFRDIRGHEKQIGILQNALARNRTPHAYLFCGMRGIGKKAAALAVAKAMNCKRGSRDACDACPSCLKIDHRNHPDVVIIEPEGQFIRIQAVRDLQDQMKFRPFEGGTRVFILVDADKMNSTAANALLKTLEEPNRNNLLILISPRPYQLPMTILSRCQMLRFSPLSRETVFQYLRERLSIAPEAANHASKTQSPMPRCLPSFMAFLYTSAELRLQGISICGESRCKSRWSEGGEEGAAPHGYFAP